MGKFYSLKEQKLIDSLFSRKSQSISNTFYTLKYICFRNTTSKVEVGISVSKKISKLAVIRNRYKRQFRASFFIHSDKLLILSQEKSMHIALFWIQHQDTSQLDNPKLDESVNELVLKLVERLSK